MHSLPSDKGKYTHHDSSSIYHQVESGESQGALGVPGAFPGPVPAARRAHACGRGPRGAWYCFERGASKLSGGDGWADVWKRGHFSWEYKGKHKDLQAAYVQLQQYSVALENPPLLIVCDLERFRIHTNWTNTIQSIYDFTLDDLHEPEQRQRLKWVFSDPERLRPAKPARC